MLTHDCFVNLRDMNTEWQLSTASEGVFEGRDHKTGELKWTGTRVGLVFGWNHQPILANVPNCALNSYSGPYTRARWAFFTASCVPVIASTSPARSFS